jgi:hypothetical protein
MGKYDFPGFWQSETQTSWSKEAYTVPSLYRGEEKASDQIRDCVSMGLPSLKLWCMHWAR